jgi:hypothetical protein
MFHVNIFAFLTMAWLAIGTVLVSQSSLEVEGKPSVIFKMIAITVAIIVTPMLVISEAVNPK